MVNGIRFLLITNVTRRKPRTPLQHADVEQPTSPPPSGVLSAETLLQSPRSVSTRSIPFGLGVVMECRVNLQPPLKYTWAKQGGDLPTTALVQEVGAGWERAGQVED